MIDATEHPWSGLRARLTSRGARRWWFGSAFALVYQGFEIYGVWSSGAPLEARIAATGMLAVVYVVFAFVPPLFFGRSIPLRVGAVLGYWALTCVLFPVVGESTVWVWTLVPALAVFTWLPSRLVVGICAAVLLGQVIIAAALGWPDSISFAPLIGLATSVSLFAFGRQILVNQQLRAARDEIGRLAAADERERLARDLHDVLGHSLTVVAMKAELGRRLVRSDPDRAEAEVGEIEHLARTALSELRDTVRGARSSDLDAELASARSALAAAGITAHIADGRAADAELRPAFGWAVREGTTNVLRHSGAHEVWIDVERERVRIRDDGHGRTDGDALALDRGSGIAGLRDRVAAFGARVVAEPSPTGFELRVERVVGA